MPRLTWNEIETRSVQFAANWAGETYERGESQTFWSQFLEIFGVDRRRHGAFFEYAIKKTGGKQGFIDLFWPGKLIVEQKSAGRDLNRAIGQAYDYLPAMPDHDLPQMIVVCDFQSFQVLNTKTNETVSFTLDQLPKRVRLFGFLIDETTTIFADEDPVNRQAAEQMAALHNQLEANRYKGRDLELLLVRLVFCLFADDALIFERNSFANYIRNRTSADGSDLGPLLNGLFEVLNTPEDERQTNLDADLRAFPYINGGLFENTLRTPQFTSAMRQSLLTATHVDWAKVSPAIFGSMFQSVMDAVERRNLGAHYTSEKNILRLIQPLFLDDIYADFEREKVTRTRLERFHQRLGTLNFLDPACGCGNFLVITYRELRRLEHKVVQELYKGQQILDLKQILFVNVDQMHGIEIEEFPSRIAQTALWLTDHQMNVEASHLLGQHFVRLPLTASANIINSNALLMDWSDAVSPDQLDYILGNPPFIGSKYMTEQNRRDLIHAFHGMDRVGVLDFVCAWYAKSADLMQSNPNIMAGLVSTNSITQGEQVGLLWSYLQDYRISIHFGHRTFKWTNDARGVAAVFCVVVGFSRNPSRTRRLFDYPEIWSDPIEYSCQNINPYLVDAPTVLVRSRQKPLVDVPEIGIGSQPLDDGNYLFTPSEHDDFIQREPNSAKYFRRWLGSQEYINGVERWGLWLGNVPPHELRSMPEVMKRVEAVRIWRLKSKRKSTVAGASQPTRFLLENMPVGESILVPKVSSERREYIPIGFVQDDVLVSDLVFLIPNASLSHFSLLTSRMHMAWLRTVCGRLKSDYRYSKDIVYNNFPWPNPTAAQEALLGGLGQTVLNARTSHPESTLADLYDPLSMPADLRKAHNAVDQFVDRLYRKQPFATDADRVALLFKRYQELTASQA